MTSLVVDSARVASGGERARRAEASALGELAALLHLTLRQRHAPLRSLVSYRAVVVIHAVGAVLLVGGAAAFSSVGMLIAASLGHSSERLTAALLVVQVYLGAGLVARELVSERRRLINSPAEVGLYRALDVSPRRLFVTLGLLPTSIAYAAVCLSSLMAAGRIAGQAPGIFTLVRVLPVVLWLVTLAVSAWCAHTPVRRHRRPWITAVGAVAGTVVAVAAMRWSLEALPQTIAGQDPRALDALLLALALTATLAVASLVRSMRRLGQTDRPLWHRGGDAHRDTATSSSASRWRRMARIARSSPAYPMVRRNVGLTLCVACAAAAVRLSGLADRIPTTILDAGRTFVAGWVLVTVILVTGLLFASIGPTALARVHRYEWENSTLTSRRIAGEAALVLLLPVLVVGLALTLADALITGAVGLTPVSVSIAAVGAALVAEAAIRPRSRADGSTSASWLMGVVVCVAMAPTMVLATSTHPVLGLTKTCFAALLFLGGVEWSARRIAPRSR